MAAVGSMGKPEAVGRRLSSPTCCRWTADDTCGSVPADRFQRCTDVHEYLEGKTTTHEWARLQWKRSVAPTIVVVRLSRSDAHANSARAHQIAFGMGANDDKSQNYLK